jgi:hypothetical protein
LHEAPAPEAVVREAARLARERADRAHRLYGQEYARYFERLAEEAERRATGLEL